MKQIAIIGTQGLPAQYGGFETLAENMVTREESTQIKYTVFCSSKDLNTKFEQYAGASLRYIPLKANGSQSIPYDILSMIEAIRGYDALLILGVSGCIFLPILRLFFRKKIIVNIDGLEHRRGKWGKWTKRFLRLSEHVAVRVADTIIVDNKGIQDYVTEVYHKPSVLIAYGGDEVLMNMDSERQEEILKSYNLTARNYSLTICRIEPENNCHITLEAFAQTGETLVFIGNWNRNAYGRSLREKYKDCPTIVFIESLYDLEPLYALRKNCKFYIHGHSAGGTNPSLVEAMFLGRPILAFDCIYNKETTEYKADYYDCTEKLTALLKEDGSHAANGEQMVEVARRRYTWKKIIGEYEETLLNE